MRERLPQVPEPIVLFDEPATSDSDFAHPWADPPEPALDLTRPRSQLTELLRLCPTPIDDLVLRCQFCPGAAMAVLLELELAGRVGTLPENRAVLLTDEAHWNE
jgi:predicted Rossmann fold nucleotide-binding protein DprA/Smf involved in DNA uptake